jgi:hypothetical protein
VDEPDGVNGIRGEVLAPALAEQAIKNLIFLATALRIHPELSKSKYDALAAKKKRKLDGNDTENVNVEAEEDDAKENSEDNDDDGVEDGVEQVNISSGGDDAEVEVKSSPLDYFMKRMNLMSRRRGDDRRVAVFQFYAAFAASQPQVVVMKYLPEMIDALYRCGVDGQSNIQTHGTKPSPRPSSTTIVTGSDGKKAEETVDDVSVAELADEVLSLLEQTAGSEAYLAAYGDVQRKFTEKRDKRKRHRAAEAVTNPEQYATQKLERNKMKKEGEKRRKRVFGEMRKMGGSSGKRSGKGKGGKRPKSSAGALKHLGGGFGRKRMKG